MAVKVTIHPSKFPVTIPQFLRVERMYNMCKMENYFLISALAILIGVTPVHGQVNLSGMERYLAIIADNSSKGIYLEDGTLVGHLLPAIDSGLAKYSMRGGRGNR